MTSLTSKTSRLLSFVLVPLALSACSAVSPTCTRELGVHLSPSAATIAVGESITGSVTLTSCGGREQLTDTIRWQLADTAVVRVDSVTGRITGVHTGSATVGVRGVHYGELGAMAVAVR